MRKAFCLYIAVFLLAGCTKSNVSGDVYIIKGDGSVIPSAGRTVRLIKAEDRASLFAQVGAEAVKSAQKALGPEIAKQCPAIIDAGAKALEGLRADMAAIKNKGTIPENGCDGLVTESSRLKAEFESVLAEQKAEIEKLQSDLQAAKKQRQPKLEKLADELYKAELDDVDVRSFRSSTSYIADHYVTELYNNSRFCIGRVELDIEYYSYDTLVHTRTHTIPEQYSLNASSVKDKFGFVKTGCYIEYGSSSLIDRVFLSELPSVDSRMRKAYSERKIKVRIVHGVERIMVTDFRSDTKINFVRVSRKELDSDVIYNSTPVDWIKEAEKSGNFDGENRLIRTIGENLKAARNRHASNQSISVYDKALESARACQADSQSIDDLQILISKGEESLDFFTDCSSASLHIFGSALPAINAAFNLGFEIPKGNKEFEAAFIIGVTETILSSSTLTSNTSMNGHYKIKGVPKGKYIMFAEYNDNFVGGFWLKPVTIDAYRQKIDLDMKFFADEDFSDYLEDVASAACENCLFSDFEFPKR